MYIIAHRGYSAKYDENTMKSFEKAIEYGADGIETDVQLSKDGVPIIIHDETLDRTMNGRGYVKDYLYKELQVFKSKNGHSIPTLEELLVLFKKSDMKILNLELKNSVIDYPNLEEKVLKLINKYKLKDKVIISSFNHYSLLRVKELDSSIITGVLTEAVIVDVEEYINKLGAECYHPFYPTVFNENIMNSLKKNNIMVNAYTINSKEEMKKAISFGIDSIITNEIQILRGVL